jgi:hypothetical protein
MPISSSWGFDAPEIAERAVSEGPLNLMMVAKAHLAHHHWSYYAARNLGLGWPSWTLPMPYPIRWNATLLDLELKLHSQSRTRRRIMLDVV